MPRRCRVPRRRRTTWCPVGDLPRPELRDPDGAGQGGALRGAAGNSALSPQQHRSTLREPAGSGADTLNTVDGSFSTWYLRGQTHLRFAHYKDSLPFVALTIATGVDWHPAFLKSIGGMDTALAAVYGRLRPFGSAELMRRSEWKCAPTFLLSWLPCGLGRLRTSVGAEYIGTHPPRVSNVATTSEIAWTFARYA